MGRPVAGRLLHVRRVLALCAAAAMAVPALAACDSGSSDSAGSAESAGGAAGSNDASGEASGSEDGVVTGLKPGDPDPCNFVSTSAVSQAVGAPVSKAFASRTVVVLPGLKKIDAFRCAYTVDGGGPILAVRVRLIPTSVDAVFNSLSRYDTAGIARMDTPPAPATDGYWQPVGRTVWVRDAKRALTVELVTEAERSGDEAAARAIAAAALAGAAAG